MCVSWPRREGGVPLQDTEPGAAQPVEAPVFVYPSGVFQPPAPVQVARAPWPRGPDDHMQIQFLSLLFPLAGGWGVAGAGTPECVGAGTHNPESPTAHALAPCMPAPQRGIPPASLSLRGARLSGC